MSPPTTSFAEKRRILQLETLYDLALALHARYDEAELIDELLERVCAVLDPAAAVAVTRDPYGGARAVSLVGWTDRQPDGTSLLAGSLWHEILAEGRMLARRSGRLAGREFREVLAAPLVYRDTFLGFLAVLDKEVRGEEEPYFSEDDRRFLDSVTALAGVSLDTARQVELLETQRERLEEENKALKDRWSDTVAGQRIIAYAPEMRRALEVVERVAPRGVSMLVRGESGTGKELVAKLLHLKSGRSGALIALNCAALPESLLESELFGIEGGVATGVDARPGKFELADGGTLFLDEIGDMQPAIQAKLLRVLQEREVVRLGGQQPIPVDVRLVAATHRDLLSMVNEGEFREDLFYRLKGVEVELPPLRLRRQDIPHLVRHFADDFCRREGLTPPVFDSDALALLLAYDYPGNVRELMHLVEGAVSLAEGAVSRELVSSLLGAGTSAPAQEGASESLELAAVEERHIAKVLQMTQGNKSAAARLLGVNRRTLIRRGF